ncbi:MAG: hypothetical protein J5818_06715 [Eggerthellaceae bacterium]|nr:hypothetical protein [Eggerthellaceae bacterium]
MADREFNIPMGPDRTGDIDLKPIDFGDGSTADDATLKSYFSEGSTGEVHRRYQSVEPIDIASEASSVEPMSDDDFLPIQDGEYESDTVSSEQARGQGLDDVQMSFVALTDSIKQGRELKSREKERDALNERVLVDREELADREDILANYHYLVAEQDDIITSSTQERDALKYELSEVTARYDETNEALSRMRDFHDGQIQPLENALARAQVDVDQAKNDERSRKSELNAAETELRRAETDGERTVASSKVQQIEAARNDAHMRYEYAKNVLDQAQDAYDDMRAEFDQAEAPLERALEDFEARSDELKDQIAQLGEVIAKARKRRQYCDEVYQRPDETAALRQDVEADEETIRQMDVENDALRAQLEQSKQKSFKAKIALGIIVAIIIIIIVAFVVTGMHAG